MKKLFSLLLILLFVFSGCSSNVKKEYDNLKLENEQLLLEKQSLENEINELKNGAEYRIAEIRSEYEKNNDDKVLSLSNELHSKYNGSPQDEEAQGYISKIKDKRETELKKKEEAEAKKKEDENKSKQDKLREIIRVKEVWIPKPNSAGGIDLYIDWVNNSTKTIKYADFSCNLYNSVNDRIKCDIRNKESFSGRCTGPFEKGQGEKRGYRWENAWYNYSASYAKLYKIEIEYMDGTTECIEYVDNVNMVIY